MGTPVRDPNGQSAEHMTAALFRGCVGRRYDAATHAAMRRLCAATGIALLDPDTQTCCGAVHAHAGNADAAAVLAARNRAAFTAGLPVVSTATGCQASLADALAGHAPVMDAAQFLLAHAEGLRFRPADRCVALHLPCSQRQAGSVSGHNVVRSDDALRALLAMIPGLHVIELPDSGCCGAAGTHMLEFPERARALRQPVLDAFQASGAELLLSANVGCRLHLQNGIDRGDTRSTGTITVRHPLDFLADFLLAVPE